LEIPPELAQIKEPLPEEQGQLREPLSDLTVELTRVSAEILSINAGFQSQLQQALTDMQRAVEADFTIRLEREVHAIREKYAESLIESQRVMDADFALRVERAVREAGEKISLDIAARQQEIDRVTALLDTIAGEITALLDDPHAELSGVMRKRSEETVLRSYLDGLKFSASSSS